MASVSQKIVISEYKLPCLPLTLDGLRTEIRYDLPELGEHSREILEELGYSKIQIDDLIAS